MKKIIGLFILVLFVFSGYANAQASYPNKPIKLLVPWPPGGGVDSTARMIAEPMSVALRQPIVIDNKAGAGGNIGTEMASRQAPDGYNLLMGSITPNAINVHIYKYLKFDPIKDFTPITFVSSLPIFLVVPAKSKFNSLDEIIKALKSNPGKFSYGSGGVGSSQHLAAAQFMMLTKTEMLHVPYKGTSPAENDLMAGHIDLMFDTATCIPFIKAGKFKAIGILSEKRNPALPNVPTIDELGLKGLYASSWYGLMGPANMPKEIVTKLNEVTNEVLKKESVIKTMARLGAVVGGGTPDDFAKIIKFETERYAGIVKKAGVRIE